MDTNDQIAPVARAAAGRLADQFGPRLVADVERELNDPNSGQPPDQYVDPISLASLVVSVAGLAWTIYQDIRRRGGEPKADTIARRVRVEAAPTTGALTSSQQDHVITVVVEEVIHQTTSGD